MCAITGSSDFEWLKTMYYRQLDRGSTSSSITTFLCGDSLTTVRQKGILDINSVKPKEYRNFYYITHSQAPTGKTSEENIHPSEIPFMWGGSSYMWHNGIITQQSLEKNNNRLGLSCSWDTELIHHMLMKYDDLSNLDGSFACIFISPEKDMFVFRNDQAPLYFDNNMSMASVKFENSFELPPNGLFYVNLYRKELVHTGTNFKSSQQLYYFGDE